MYKNDGNWCLRSAFIWQTLSPWQLIFFELQSNVKSLDYQEKAINHAYHAPFVLNQAGYSFNKRTITYQAFMKQKEPPVFKKIPDSNEIRMLSIYNAVQGI